jgi:hypothetical protein
LPAAVEGLYNCERANRAVYIFKDWALNEKPEFSSIINATEERNVSEITIDDYVAYRMQDLQKGNFGGLEDNKQHKQSNKRCIY